MTNSASPFVTQTSSLSCRAGILPAQDGQDVVRQQPRSLCTQKRRNEQRPAHSHSAEGIRSPMLDQSAIEIVDTAKRTGARVAGPFHCRR